MVSVVDSINEILSEINDNPVQNLDNPSDTDAKRYESLFLGTHRDLLSLIEWNFSRKYLEITPLANVDENNGYKFVYKIPTDRVGSYRILDEAGNYDSGYDYGAADSGLGSHFLSGDKIYSDEEPLKFLYHAYTPYEQCPAFFQYAVKLAAKPKIFRSAIGEPSDSFRVDALRALEAAKQANSQTVGGFTIHKRGSLLQSSFRRRGRRGDL